MQNDKNVKTLKQLYTELTKTFFLPHYKAQCITYAAMIRCFNTDKYLLPLITHCNHRTRTCNNERHNVYVQTVHSLLDRWIFKEYGKILPFDNPAPSNWYIKVSFVLFPSLHKQLFHQKMYNDFDIKLQLQLTDLLIPKPIPDAIRERDTNAYDLQFKQNLADVQNDINENVGVMKSAQIDKATRMQMCVIRKINDKTYRHIQNAYSLVNTFMSRKAVEIQEVTDLCNSLLDAGHISAEKMANILNNFDNQKLMNQVQYTLSQVLKKRDIVNGFIYGSQTQQQLNSFDLVVSEMNSVIKKKSSYTNDETQKILEFMSKAFNMTFTQLLQQMEYSSSYVYVICSYFFENISNSQTIKDYIAATFRATPKKSLNNYHVIKVSLPSMEFEAIFKVLTMCRFMQAQQFDNFNHLRLTFNVYMQRCIIVLYQRLFESGLRGKIYLKLPNKNDNLNAINFYKYVYQIICQKVDFLPPLYWFLIIDAGIIMNTSYIEDSDDRNELLNIVRWKISHIEIWEKILQGNPYKRALMFQMPGKNVIQMILNRDNKRVKIAYIQLMCIIYDGLVGSINEKASLIFNSLLCYIKYQIPVQNFLDIIVKLQHDVLNFRNNLSDETLNLLLGTVSQLPYFNAKPYLGNSLGYINSDVLPTVFNEYNEFSYFQQQQRESIEIGQIWLRYLKI